MNILKIFSICSLIGFVYSECEIDFPGLKSKGIVAECVDSTEMTIIGDAKPNCISPQATGTKVILKCPEYHYAGVGSSKVSGVICLTNSTWSENLDQIECYPECGQNIQSVTYLEVQPWRVVIYKRIVTTSNLCYGTLISKYEVLAAETCIQSIPKDQLGVRLDTGFKNASYNTVKFVLRESSPASPGPGLVILSMQREATIEDHAMPICLPSAQDIFKNVQLLQPGDSFETGSNSNQIRNLTLVNPTECRNTVEDQEFCVAGKNSDSWTGITVGDERKMLLGILTENIANTGNHLSFFNVQRSMPWIKTTLEEVSQSRSSHDGLVKFLNDSSAMVSVILERLDEKDPSKKSVEILKQISYLSSENIPTVLFQGAMPNENIDLMASIHTLAKFSLVKMNGGTISVLPGLQKSLRQYLSKSPSEEKRILKSTVDLIQQQFSLNKVNDTNAALTTHAISVWQHVTKFENLTIEYESFYLNIYETLNAEQRFSEIITFSDETFPLIRKIFGESHNLTISVRSKLEEVEEQLKNITNWSDDVDGFYTLISKECADENSETCVNALCEVEISDYCMD